MTLSYRRFVHTATELQQFFGAVFAEVDVHCIWHPHTHLICLSDTLIHSLRLLSRECGDGTGNKLQLLRSRAMFVASIKVVPNRWRSLGSPRENVCRCLQWCDSGEPRDRQNLVAGCKVKRSLINSRCRYPIVQLIMTI